MEGGRGLKLSGDEVAEIGEVSTPSSSAALFMKKKSLAPLDDEPVSSSSSSAKKRGCLGAAVNDDDLEDGGFGLSKADATMMPPAIPTMDFPSRRLERESRNRGARMRTALERASARRGQRAGRRDDLRRSEVMLGSTAAVVGGESSQRSADYMSLDRSLVK